MTPYIKFQRKKIKLRNFSQITTKTNKIKNHIDVIDDYFLNDVAGGTRIKTRVTAAMLALLPVLPQSVRAAGGKGKNQKGSSFPLHTTRAESPDVWDDDIANEKLDAIIESVKNERSADVNSNYSRKSRTPLMYAAAKSNVDIVEKLLRHGAGINTQDADGWTPIMFAIARSNPSDKMEIIEKLLAHGADINLPNNQGKTAMDLALEARNSQIVASILRSYASKKGYTTTSGNLLLDTIREKNYTIAHALLRIPHMDITAKNEHGQTALMLAVEDNQAEIIKELLSKNFSQANEPDKDGLTP